MKQDLSRKWMVGKGYWNGYQGHYYGKSRNSTGFHSTAKKFFVEWLLLAGFLHQIVIVFGLVKYISLPRRLSLWIHKDDVGVWGLPNNPAYHTQKLDAYKTWWKLLMHDCNVRCGWNKPRANIQMINDPQMQNQCDLNKSQVETEAISIECSFDPWRHRWKFWKENQLLTL